MTQKQSGGDGVNNQAGRDVVIHNHYGVTEERFEELARKLEEQAIELWCNNSPRLGSEARSTYDNRAVKMTTQVITKTVAKDPELLERFSDPRAQVVLLKAQQAYGETGDDELADLLSGLVVALVGKPIRDRREILLREAIECAPRLTRQHLNALVVISLITRMSFRFAHDVENVITLMDQELRPYYGEIPTDVIEYSYLGATAAGLYLPTLGKSPYDSVFARHVNAMYSPFAPAEVPDDWGLNEDQSMKLGSMLWLLRADPIEQSRIKLRPESADIILRPDPNAQPPLTDLQMKLREFVQPRSINAKKFTEVVRAQKPEMADFFDVLSDTMALHFQPSPVGFMLAKHTIATRSEQTAEQMDKIFGDAA